MNRPSCISKINKKPFWKEPSLKHVWARADEGARYLIFMMAFLIVVAIIGFAFGIKALLITLIFALGFIIGWAVRDLSDPAMAEMENKFEFQAIEFGDDI